jgi:hypothetical protein
MAANSIQLSRDSPDVAQIGGMAGVLNWPEFHI